MNKFLPHVLLIFAASFFDEENSAGNL